MAFACVHTDDAALFIVMPPKIDYIYIITQTCKIKVLNISVI